MNNNELKWYIIRKDYVDYLKKFDEKVQNIEYYNTAKPYIGVVFSINDFKYYVPISSKKQKYNKMKENMDFIKIIDNKQILSVINLNNMIPVIKEELKLLKYEEIANYFCFDDEISKQKYIRLLKKEINIINQRKDEIIKRAKKLYKLKNKFPNSSLGIRCCDFKLLEQKCLEYKK